MLGKSPPKCLGRNAPRVNQSRQETYAPKHLGMYRREISRSEPTLPLPAPFSAIILEAVGRAGTQAGVLRTSARARWFDLKRERLSFGRARCKRRAHTTGTDRARGASISRTLNSRLFFRSSKFEKLGMSELGKSTRRMVLLSNFYSSVAPNLTATPTPMHEHESSSQVSQTSSENCTSILRSVDRDLARALSPKSCDC